MLNVRRSTTKVQCPMLNVNLLNEQRSTTRAQCTMYSGQRPGCNVQCSMSTCSMYNVQCATSKGQCATYRVQEQCTNVQLQPTFKLNNQLSTGSTVGSPWPGLRYQFEGSNKLQPIQEQPHEVSPSLETGGASFSRQRRHGSRCSSGPSHLRRSRVEVAKGFVPSSGRSLVNLSPCHGVTFTPTIYGSHLVFECRISFVWNTGG